MDLISVATASGDLKSHQIFTSKASTLIIGFPPDPGRNRPQTYDLLRKMTDRTLPRTPGGGDKNKTKSVLTYGWVVAHNPR